MPSSPGYKRNYKQEYKTSQSSTAEKKRRAMRNSARRRLMNEGKVSKGDGKDVDHKRALTKGGSNSRSNLQVLYKGDNRSFKRTRTGSIK